MDVSDKVVIKMEDLIDYVIDNYDGTYTIYHNDGTTTTQDRETFEIVDTACNGLLSKYIRNQKRKRLDI